MSSQGDSSTPIGRSVYYLGLPIAVVSVLLAFVFAHAETRRVPEDYPSIQSALNAVVNGDTVLVSPGVYSETLTAPASRFLLKGDVADDSLPGVRPIVDPSSLMNPQSLGCLWLPAGSLVVIEDFVFRNGAPMYPHIFGIAGGIRCFADSVVLRRCLFDSTSGGFAGDGTVVDLESCDFRFNDSWCCIPNGRLNAVDCRFDGQGSNLVSSHGETSFDGCTFSGNTTGELLVLWYGPVSITNCRFGPYGPLGFSPVSLNELAGEIDGCEFAHGVGGSIFVHLTLSPDSGETAIRNSHFHDNTDVALLSISSQAAATALLENNVFETSHAQPSALISGIGSDAATTMTHNRIQGLGPQNRPAIRLANGQSVLHENWISENGYGLAFTAAGELDARFNWWGDSSGPYHTALNPNGLGDQVSDNVLFDPWLTDTTNNVRNESPISTPELFSLECYPNPFNSEVTLTLFSIERAEIQIELFDLQGRLVREIWTGTVSGTKTLRFDANGLSSGIYFVRANSLGANKTRVSTKLILLK